MKKYNPKPHYRRHNRKTDAAGSQSLKSRVYRFFTSIWGILTIISTLVGLYGIKQIWGDEFTSEEDKWYREHYVRGILIPPSVLNSDSLLTIRYGTNKTEIPIRQLREGVEFGIGNAISSFLGESPFDMRLLYKNSRLYVSATFKEFAGEELVGRLRYENWELFKPNLGDYHSTDEFLEVVDRRGHVIFSIGYQSGSTVAIQGYYIGKTGIFVASQRIGLFTKDIPGNKESALEEIKLISRLYNRL